MLNFLLENNLLSKKQHGFMSKRSTLTNVISSLNKWFNALNSNHSVHCILIDFAKAFDTVFTFQTIIKIIKKWNFR